MAEAARQERARKQTQQKKSKHVYTAEDLKREHILTPEDRAQLEARKNQHPASPANARKSQDAVDGSAVDASLPANATLGDVARRARKQKQSQQLQRSTEFHLPFADTPVLASPKSPVQPMLPPVSVRPPVKEVKPAPRVLAPFRPFVKRSPFERPRVLPPSGTAAPATPRALAHPSAAPRVPAAPPRAAAPPHAFNPTPPPAHVVPAPPRTHVAPSPPISGKLSIVTVKPGDSLWKFAATRLGDGRRWQELLSLNPEVRDPNLIQAGTQIILPASLAPPRAPTKYTVRHGDTLWTIAEIQLGHGAFWACIAHANPNLRDARLIHQGQVLLLPASCPK